MAKTPEGEIKREIMDYLYTLGGVVEPLYTGAAKAPGGRYRTPKSSRGRPDIFILLNSIPIAIEVKAGTKQKTDQEEWMMRWIFNGGVYWLVTSLDQVKENLAQLIRSYG